MVKHRGRGAGSSMRQQGQRAAGPGSGLQPLACKLQVDNVILNKIQTTPSVHRSLLTPDVADTGAGAGV